MVKKLAELIRKYVCTRVDMRSWEEDICPVLPIAKYGKLEPSGIDSKKGWYVRLTLPCFQFGFEKDFMRRMEVAAWRVPVIYFALWEDKLTFVQTIWEVWEEDTQLTLEEEVRRGNELNNGYHYRLEDRHIAGMLIVPPLFYEGYVEKIATDHLREGQAVCIDPNNPGAVIPCGTGQGV